MEYNNNITIICEYCDTRIVLNDDKTNCPACGAPLGSAIESAIKAREDARQKEEEKAALLKQEEQKRLEREQLISGAIGLVSGIAGSAARPAGPPMPHGRPDRPNGPPLGRPEGRGRHDKPDKHGRG